MNHSFEIRSASKCPFLLGFILAGFLLGCVMIIDEPGHLEKTRRTSSIQRHNVEITDRLRRDVKILCLVLTHPLFHESFAEAVKATWGRRCTSLIFVSRSVDPRFPTLNLRTKSGDDWAKFKELFQQINDQYLSQYHWFYVANDRTYTIMENMRLFLARYSHDLPIYFGKKLKYHVEQGCMVPKAGVVFSRAAVRRFVEKSPRYCESSATGLSANIKLGDCMETLGVIAGDARDSDKRELFYHVNPMAAMFAGYSEGRQNNDYYARQPGMISSQAIAFHQIGDHEMYQMEYLVHRLEVYGKIWLPASVAEPLVYRDLMASFVETADSEETH